ncbi:hypothetical protein EJ06DRAFT_520225 [Trichodelitschia bisporula]|uniref:Uncharacterized protein n=1 Tax=Trichodelitschia bisporula TaxID=703511 RepID=A0A6G1I254_9PEZI|nr:hypothetical protein EJ06DRAFT_520225 [Trichodelitschia bisporula]
MRKVPYSSWETVVKNPLRDVPKSWERVVRWTRLGTIKSWSSYPQELPPRVERPFSKSFEEYKTEFMSYFAWGDAWEMAQYMKYCAQRDARPAAEIIFLGQGQKLQRPRARHCDALMIMERTGCTSVVSLGAFKDA